MKIDSCRFFPIVGLFLACVLFGVFDGKATNIDNLKGTYSILPAELRELSPLEGAVAWHTGLVRRLYDLGHAKEGEPQKTPLQADYTNPDEFHEDFSRYSAAYNEWLGKIQSPSVRVARTLFYRVPGTTSVADFTLSKRAIKGKTDDDFAQEVARGVVGLWLYKRLLDIGIADKILTNLHVLNNVATIKTGEFKEVLKDSALPGYDTVCLLLLAALWAKCGTNREALKVYFTALMAQLSALKSNLSGQQGLKKEVRDGLNAVFERIQIDEMQVLENDTFVRGDVEEIKKEVRDLSNIEDLKNPEVYEKVVYVRLLPSDQPEDTGYGIARLCFPRVEQGIEFSDCADTMMRNFFNHLIFEKGVFSSSILNSLIGVEPHDALKTFYEKNDDPNRIAERAVHDAWTKVISHIPCVAYNRVTSSQQESLPGKGYINVPKDGRTEAVRTFLRDNKYTIIEDDGVIGYELMPSYRNVILVVDYLLNVGLFKDKDMVVEFVRADFVEEYLPKVFEKIGELTSTHREDLGNVTLKLKRGTGRSYAVTFQLTSNHAQFKSERLYKGSLPVLDRVNKTDLETLPKTMPMLISASTFERLLQDAYTYVLPMFAQAVEDSDVAIGFLKALGGEINEYWASLMEFLIGRSTDPDRRLSGLLDLYARLVNVGRESFFTKAIAAAVEGVESQDCFVRFRALDLLEALFKKGYGFTEARDLLEKLKDDTKEDLRLVLDANKQFEAPKKTPPIHIQSGGVASAV